MRATGFNPASLSKKRDIQWSEKQIAAIYSEQRTRFNERVRTFYIKRLEARGLTGCHHKFWQHWPCWIQKAQMKIYRGLCL